MELRAQSKSSAEHNWSQTRAPYGGFAVLCSVAGWQSASRGSRVRHPRQVKEVCNKFCRAGVFLCMRRRNFVRIAFFTEPNRVLGRSSNR